MTSSPHYEFPTGARREWDPMFRTLRKQNSLFLPEQSVKLTADIEDECCHRHSPDGAPHSKVDAMEGVPTCAHRREGQATSLRWGQTASIWGRGSTIASRMPVWDCADVLARPHRVPRHCTRQRDDCVASPCPNVPGATPQSSPRGTPKPRHHGSRSA